MTIVSTRGARLFSSVSKKKNSHQLNHLLDGEFCCLFYNVWDRTSIEYQGVVTHLFNHAVDMDEYIVNMRRETASLMITEDVRGLFLTFFCPALQG